ncbi:MAG: M28 family peptidase [Muribaculaceae bacterium]
MNNNNGDHKPFDIALQEQTDNSDHYAFDQAGVPSIYFSTEGNYLKDYHSPRDCSSNYSADNFYRLFSLITSYISNK